MTEKLKFALKGFRLGYTGKVTGGSPRGEAGRQASWWFGQTEQMAAEQAAWHALTFIQVHREGKSQKKSDCLHFCC